MRFPFYFRLFSAPPADPEIPGARRPYRRTTHHSGGGVDTTSEPENEYPKYDIDLGGEDFNILFFDAVKACGWSSDIPCDVDVAEQTGDVLSDAVYTRNRKIEDMYNLRIRAYDSGDDAWACYKVLEKSVMSGSGEYDAAFCKQQGFEQAAGNGYVTQLDDLLDFDKPWWDSKSLEGFSVLGKTLAVSGDVTFMDKLSYIVIYFNKPMADDYNLGDIYQMVIDKQWTFDKMLSMCGLVSADLNEDGKMDKEDSRVRTTPVTSSTSPRARDSARLTRTGFRICRMTLSARFRFLPTSTRS